MSDRAYMVVGTASTPNNLGVIQIGTLLHPICGYCFKAPAFSEEPDTDELQWVCVGCGHDFKLEGTCDISLHWATTDPWLRHTISVWTGLDRDSLIVGRVPATP